MKRKSKHLTLKIFKYFQFKGIPLKSNLKLSWSEDKILLNDKVKLKLGKCQIGKKMRLIGALSEVNGE